ncbi:hypothetical protein [Nostoc sp. UHCC 0870]|uniref:hypothetical protein n=1 Tax=Nostoc sp. UHCC 0870 TaxID=2914041 RepID=UPI001EE0A967|nr:hypothetical protein [Nostoc sp. UHCC 0870]UKP01459.1 hypothetical protein L6494_30100 [Nostoc sp. UHCC 0870]
MSRRIPSQIEVRNDCIIIRNLEISLYDAVDYLSSIPSDEYEQTCINIFEVGFFCIQRIQNRNDTEFVRREFDYLLAELYKTVATIPQALETRILSQLGAENKQILAPMQSQIGLTKAFINQQIDEVKRLFQQEIDVSKNSSTLGIAIRKIENLLDSKRTDSIPGVFAESLKNITLENGVLTKSVKAVVGDAVKPLAQEVEKLRQQIREKEMVESVLEQTIAKGATYEESIVVELQQWSKMGAEIYHVGKDKEVGDILIKFTSNSIVACDLSIIIEARNRDSASWGRKRIADQLNKAMMKRKATAGIFLSRNREGLAQEIGYWAQGICEQGQWVATTHEMLNVAIQFLVITQQLAAQKTLNPELNYEVLESQLQRIQVSLDYLSQFNSHATSIEENCGAIRAKSKIMRNEICSALNSITDSINQAQASR